MNEKLKHMDEKLKHMDEKAKTSNRSKRIPNTQEMLVDVKLIAQSEIERLKAASINGLNAEQTIKLKEQTILLEKVSKEERQWLKENAYSKLSDEELFDLTADAIDVLLQDKKFRNQIREKIGAESSKLGDDS